MSRGKSYFEELPPLSVRRDPGGYVQIYVRDGKLGFFGTGGGLVEALRNLASNIERAMIRAGEGVVMEEFITGKPRERVIPVTYASPELAAKAKAAVARRKEQQR